MSTEDRPELKKQQSSFIAEFTGPSLLFSDKFHLITQSGLPVSPDFLLGKVICLLFGAAWSPPFTDFLALFKSFHEDLQADGAPMEVIYISFDRTSEEMMALISDEFPESWVAVPHGSSMINYLKLKYSIVVIPKLVVVRDNGDLITDKGVKEVRKRTKRCFTNWYNVANETQLTDN